MKYRVLQDPNIHLRLNQWFPQGYCGQNHGTSLLPNWEANRKTGRADLQSKKRERNIKTKFSDSIKPRSFTVFCRLHNLLNCKFFGSTGVPAFRTFKKSKSTVQPGKTLHCDWSKVWKDGGSPVLPKNLHFSRLIFETV